jgi:phosphoribosyl-ATP pyrophosphohydrolase
MDDSLHRLYRSVQSARTRDPALSRTAKLFQDGMEKMAKKLAEEAVEVGIDAVLMRRHRVILESADLLYNLSVLWAASAITPDDVAQEIDRRELLYGIAEKLPKSGRRPKPKKARPARILRAAAG